MVQYCRTYTRLVQKIEDAMPLSPLILSLFFFHIFEEKYFMLKFEVRSFEMAIFLAFFHSYLHSQSLLSLVSALEHVA
jgi:hypothetical protein